jgi:hypothetical protein
MCPLMLSMQRAVTCSTVWDSRSLLVGPVLLMLRSMLRVVSAVRPKPNCSAMTMRLVHQLLPWLMGR